MNPKFSVNEIVIVQSPHYPEINGEYEILEIFTPQEFQEHCKGQFQSESKSFVYRMKDLLVHGKVNPQNKTDCASEPNLRKKHQPSEFSFNVLMDNLKLPQKQEN